MRHFYSNLLQLDELYYAAGEEGGLAYRCNALQFTIFESPLAKPASPEWHRQPGWPGGSLVEPSWSIESESEEAFRAALIRLKNADTRTYFEFPRWFGYWSFPVKDPMGNTVEITYPPKNAPIHDVWRK